MVGGAWSKGILVESGRNVPQEKCPPYLFGPHGMREARIPKTRIGSSLDVLRILLDFLNP